MIYADILMRKNEENSKSKRRIAMIGKFQMSCKKVFKEDKSGILVISGDGHHQEGDFLRADDYFSAHVPHVEKILNVNPDYIDELVIAFQSEDIKRILKAAIHYGMLEISDLLPEKIIDSLNTVQKQLIQTQGDLTTTIEEIKPKM